MISRFPEDYTLFEVGEWDNTKGELIPLQVSVPLGINPSFSAFWNPSCFSRLLTGLFTSINTSFFKSVSVFIFFFSSSICCVVNGS